MCVKKRCRFQTSLTGFIWTHDKHLIAANACQIWLTCLTATGNGDGAMSTSQRTELLQIPNSVFAACSFCTTTLDHIYINWNDPAGFSCTGDGWVQSSHPWFLKTWSASGKVAHKPEQSLTVTHTCYVCNTSEARAARDLWFLRKTGTCHMIRPQESKFRVQQRRRGNIREDQTLGQWSEQSWCWNLHSMGNNMWTLFAIVVDSRADFCFLAGSNTRCSKKTVSLGWVSKSPVH